MDIVGTAGPELARDLELIGFRLVKPAAERCSCATCRALDTQFDVDALAVGPRGLPCFISYRRQPEYDYQTITIRWANDKGNEDVQARKIIDGRSKADLFVQGYPSGVSYSLAGPVRAALTLDPECNHPKTRAGAQGQVLRILCATCCPGIHYAPRTEVTVQPSPSSEFETPEFIASWTAS